MPNPTLLFQNTHIVASNQSNLNIYLGESSLAVLVVHENETIIVENYPFGYNAVNELTNWLETTTLLKEKYAKIQVAFGCLHNSTIPNAFFNVNTFSSLLQAQYGDMHNTKALYNSNHTFQLHTAYNVPLIVLKQIIINLPQASYFHYQSAVLQYMQPSILSTNAGLQLHFLGDAYTICLHNKQKLMHIKTYAITDNETLIYNILAVIKLYHLSPAELPVIVAGWLATKSSLYQTLYAYLPNINTGDSMITINKDATNIETHYLIPTQVINNYKA